MFFEPEPTPWDLRWRMLGTPVRVHPLFWLFTAILGWTWADPKNGGSLGYLALWIGCVFVSLLLHEFGHIGMGRLFGGHGHIILYSFGGLAVGSADLRSRWKRIAVSLAGPGVQLALYGLLLLFVRKNIDFLLSMRDRWVLVALSQLLEINLWWPLFNLLPVWPLDGGRVSRDLLEWITPAKGLRLALWLSVLVGAGLAVYGFKREQYWLALMFAMLALSSFQLLQQLRAASPRERQETWRQRDPWEQDPDYWKR